MLKHKRIFHGWWIVATCFVVNFVVFGIAVNTFTVYVKPLQADMGWTRGQISLGVTLAALSMGGSAPIIGKVIDVIGARIAMAAGAAIVGVCTYLLSEMQSLGGFYALFVLSGVGQGAATLIPVSLVIANWFDTQRSRALGLAMTGTGLGAMVMVPVTSWVISTWGWRTSYRVMGFIILGVVPLVAVLIRTRPQEMGLHADGTLHHEDTPPPVDGLSLAAALRTRSFWLVGAMMLFAGLVGLGVGVHMMAYLTDIGHSNARASLIIAIISGLTVIGKIGLGALADHRNVRVAVALSYGLMVVGILLLMGSTSFVVACVFAVIWGIAIGAPLLLNPAMAAECLGLAHFGIIFGALSLLTTVGAAIGAVLSGVIYDSTGSYVPAFALYAGLLVMAGLCGIAARPALDGPGSDCGTG